MLGIGVPWWWKMFVEANAEPKVSSMPSRHLDLLVIAFNPGSVTK